MTTKKTNPDNPVARLRERYWDWRRSRKPSPIVKEIYEQEQAREREKAQKEKSPEKKIARPHDPEVGA